MDINEALKSMDALDDDQWTADGAPKVDFVSELLGEKVSRQDILNAGPHFTRTNMYLLGEEEAPEEVQGSEEESDTEVTGDFSGIEHYLKDDPLVEKAFVKFLYDLPKDNLDPLEKVLIEQLQATEEAISRAEELKNRVKRSLAFTRGRIKIEMPDVSNQQAIQLFIKSQAEQRAKGIQKSQEVLKMIGGADFDGRAAIDRAMARKTGRGGKRPVHPLKNKL